MQQQSRLLVADRPDKPDKPDKPDRPDRDTVSQEAAQLG